MKACDFFVRGRELDREAKGLLSAKIRAAEMAEISGVKYGEKMQGGGENRAEKRLLVLAEYSQMLDRKLCELYSVRGELMVVLEGVPDARHRMLLTERYINCQTWEGVASRMGYSARQVARLHKKALAAAQVVLECHTRNVV